MADAQVTLKVTPGELRTIKAALTLYAGSLDAETKGGNMDGKARQMLKEESVLADAIAEKF